MGGIFILVELHEKWSGLPCLVFWVYPYDVDGSEQVTFSFDTNTMKTKLYLMEYVLVKLKISESHVNLFNGTNFYICSCRNAERAVLFGMTVPWGGGGQLCIHVSSDCLFLSLCVLFSVFLRIPIAISIWKYTRYYHLHT